MPPFRGPCFLCGQEADRDRDFDTRAEYVDCAACGDYELEERATYDLPPANDALRTELFKLSGMTRRATVPGQPRFKLTHTNIPDLLRGAPVPKIPFDAFDNLLTIINEFSPSPISGLVVFSLNDWPLTFSRDLREFRTLLGKAERIGWIEMTEQSNGFHCEITIPLGWTRLGDIRKAGRATRQAFVAMSFHPDMLEAFTQGIVPAILSADYLPMRVDRAEYNDRVDDKILMEIRRSGFAVADFTLGREGVYFEAGFAQGLGLPVIYIVRRDWLERLHFDTRQQNYVVWETIAELKERLHDRVLGTIGPPKVELSSYTSPSPQFVGRCGLLPPRAVGRTR